MTKLPIAQVLGKALRTFRIGLSIREEADKDFAFICDLYAEVRQDELAPVPWTSQAKRDFLDAQCRLQRDHYGKNYPAAELLTIVCDDDPIGRIYVHATHSEIRLMEITLRDGDRNKGIGTALIRELQVEAKRRNLELTLHVEPANPAQQLYRRLGFRLIENRGVYDFLGWSANNLQLNTASN